METGDTEARMYAIARPIELPDGTRTCSKCGNEFAAFGHQSKCPQCRKMARTVKVIAIDTPLTNREKQVIGLIREALENKEIAYRLKLSTGTIKQYLLHVMAKTGARNRVDLALKAERGQI